MVGCSGADEGSPQAQEALGVQRPSVPLHSRPHGHCLLQLEPLGLGLEVGLGFTPLSCLRSSGEEVPQARAPPTLREDQAPAHNGFKAGSQTDFHWITALKLREELCLWGIPGGSGKGSPPRDAVAWVRVHGEAGHPCPSCWPWPGCLLTWGPTYPPCKGLTVLQELAQF